MTCTLSRNGLSFSRANDREYGAWGDIRSGSGGDQGYVANLGHRRDSESGLTYMRVRYYEPTTGRFVSVDPAMDGGNWYVYCRNNPVAMVDSSGKSPKSEFLRWLFWDVAFQVIFGHVPANSPYYKLTYAIIANTLNAIASANAITTLAAITDPRFRAYGTAVATGVALACIAIAAQQLILLEFLIAMDVAGHRDTWEGWWGNQAGFTLF